MVAIFITAIAWLTATPTSRTMPSCVLQANSAAQAKWLQRKPVYLHFFSRPVTAHGFETNNKG
jgi:hypothetical protein